VATWPTYDEKKTVDAEVDMAIQVNGKFRGTMRIAADVSQEEAQAAALETDIVKRQLAAIGGQVRKTIVVPGKLINLIIK
jgi:leucyl-tRNA synthetase